MVPHKLSRYLDALGSSREIPELERDRKKHSLVARRIGVDSNQPMSTAVTAKLKDCVDAVSARNRIKPNNRFKHGKRTRRRIRTGYLTIFVRLFNECKTQSVGE